MLDARLVRKAIDRIRMRAMGTRADDCIASDDGREDRDVRVLFAGGFGFIW
jgi:hypothetical protein